MTGEKIPSCSGEILSYLLCSNHDQLVDHYVTFTGGVTQAAKKKRLGYSSLEALDTKVSMVLASTVSCDRSFQSLIVLGRNEYFRHRVRQ